MAYQHILGHSVPYNGVEDVIKEWRYNILLQVSNTHQSEVQLHV